MSTAATQQSPCFVLFCRVNLLLQTLLVSADSIARVLDQNRSDAEKKIIVVTDTKWN